MLHYCLLLLLLPSQHELLGRKLLGGPSESVLGDHLHPCRDPDKDAVLAALHALEAYRPAAMAWAQDALLLLRSLLVLAVLALNAAAVAVRPRLAAGAAFGREGSTHGVKGGGWRWGYATRAQGARAWWAS